MPFDAVSAAGPSQCDHATLEGDDVELWLIRCPPGFDTAELHERTIDLSQGGPTVLGSGSQASGYSLRPIPAIESAGVVGVFPSAQSKRWLLGKQIARQFAISRTPAGAASSAGAQRLPTILQVPGQRLRNAAIGSIGNDIVAPPAPSRKRAAEEPPAGSEGKKKSKKKSEGKAESGTKKAKKSAAE
jgi:hypothetical protein|tara:strand:+ start:86 stop:646 length:561 start_codon:yes stop_codon:yes gene_type:complete